MLFFIQNYFGVFYSPYIFENFLTSTTIYMIKKVLLAACLFSLSAIIEVNGQNGIIKKLLPLKAEDFKVQSTIVDGNTDAVIIADIGSSEYEGNTSGWFTIIYKRTKRILIRHKKAFDLATVKVPIYKGASTIEEENFMDFEAATYNLEGGGIVESKLSKSDIYKEKYNSYYDFRNFSFTNVKEGSIIQYTYTIKSPYYSHLREWKFQDYYPVLWSQYQVSIPSIFDFYIRTTKQKPFSVDSFSLKSAFYSVSDAHTTSATRTYNLTGNDRVHIWAMKDAPALKSEPFITTASNFITKVEFNLRAIVYSESNIEKIMKDWKATAKDILKKDEYKSIYEKHSWLNDALTVSLENKSDVEKVKLMYEYVRDNFSCNGNESIWPSQSIKETFNTKTGNVAAINLLLMSLLHNKGYLAKPVILSTRENGRSFNSAAIVEEYNYVVASITIDGKQYLLDASQPKLGFGIIAPECLNDAGRLIDEDKPLFVPMSADSVFERKYSSMVISADTINHLSGSYFSNLGSMESLQLRRRLAKEKKADIINSVATSSEKMDIEDFSFDMVDSYDDPLVIRYMVNVKLEGEDILYFNPMFNASIRDNPFHAAERFFPVEMPSKIDDTYTLEMEVPKGYEIDELPKSVRVMYNENEGMFEYIVLKTKTSVQLKCRLVFYKANFLAEDYASLRDFYGMIVKKEAEHFVFKKIKK